MLECIDSRRSSHHPLALSTYLTGSHWTGPDFYVDGLRCNHVVVKPPGHHVDLLSSWVGAAPSPPSPVTKSCAHGCLPTLPHVAYKALVDR